MNIYEKISVGTAGVAIAAMATIIALRSDLGNLTVQCYPGTDDCAMVFAAKPEQCPALLRNGGENRGPIIPEDAPIGFSGTGYRENNDDESLGVALVKLLDAGLITTFVTERVLDPDGRDLPCVVDVFLTRQQATGLRSAIASGKEDASVRNIPDLVIIDGQPARGGVVMFGQDEPEKRTEQFDL